MLRHCTPVLWAHLSILLRSTSICPKLYWNCSSPSCKPVASGYWLNLSLYEGRRNQNKGYSETCSEKGSPSQVQALCSCMGVGGWLEHIYGELTRLSWWAVPQHPPAPPSAADERCSVQQKYSVKAKSLHSHCHSPRTAQMWAVCEKLQAAATHHPTQGGSLFRCLGCLHSLCLQQKRLSHNSFPIISVCCSLQKSNGLFLHQPSILKSTFLFV